MVATLLHVRIHSAGIVLEKFPITGWQLLRHSFSHGSKPQDSLLLVKIEPGHSAARRSGKSGWGGRGSTRCRQNFRQLAPRETPCHIHLPEPVLRCDVTLREEKVIQTGYRYMWNAVFIAYDVYGSLQTGNSKRAVKLRQGTVTP